MTPDFQLCETEQAMSSGTWDEAGRVWTCNTCGTRRVFSDYEDEVDL